MADEDPNAFQVTSRYVVDAACHRGSRTSSPGGLRAGQGSRGLSLHHMEPAPKGRQQRQRHLTGRRFPLRARSWGHVGTDQHAQPDRLMQLDRRPLMTDALREALVAAPGAATPWRPPGMVRALLVDDVGAGAAVERVEAGAAVEHVIAGAAQERVRAGASGEHVVAVAAVGEQLDRVCGEP